MPTAGSDPCSVRPRLSARSARVTRIELDILTLLRRGMTNQEIAVDLSRADSQAATLQVRSGDQILVPTKTNAFRDYIGPITSTIAALAAITSIILR